MDFVIKSSELIDPENEVYEGFQTLRVLLDCGKTIIVYQNKRNRFYQTKTPAHVSVDSFSSLESTIQDWLEKKQEPKPVFATRTYGGESNYRGR